MNLRRSHLRRQSLNRLEDGRTELIRFSPLRPPVEGHADISTSQPEADAAYFVDHCVLHTPLASG